MIKAAQLAGNSRTAEITPEVKIISMTTNPIGLIGSIWYGSRQVDEVSVEDLQSIYDNPYKNYSDNELETAKKLVRAFPQYYGHNIPGVEIDFDHPNRILVRELLIQLIQICLKANLPVSEAVALTIQVNDASVAWREQLVRSKFSSYFMHTSRIADMSKMDVNRSPSIGLIAGQEGIDIYNDTVETIRQAYKKLADLGVPQEDIRLQPQMHTHRVYWMTDFRALLTTLSNRSGWIAQASLWTPITAGIINELRQLNLMDVLEEFLGNPPVTISYESDYDMLYVSEYKLKADNEDRILGKDPLPVDPLYLNYLGESMPEHTDIGHYDYLKSLFSKIWNDKVLKMLGWSRENPDQIGPYDRPRSYFETAKSNSDLNIINENPDYYKSVVSRATQLEVSRGGSSNQ